MNTEQILKVLKNERECIARQNGKCDRNCKECDLCLPDTEILEVYDFLINGYELLQNEGAESYSIKYDVSKEESEKIIKEKIIKDLQECQERIVFNSGLCFKPLPDNFKTVLMSLDKCHSCKHKVVFGDYELCDLAKCEKEIRNEEP